MQKSKKQKVFVNLGFTTQFKINIALKFNLSILILKFEARFGNKCCLVLNIK